MVVTLITECGPSDVGGVPVSGWAWKSISCNRVWDVSFVTATFLTVWHCYG